MAMKMNEVIEFLDLQAHPEGGYFKETYRSKGYIKEENLDDRYSSDRNYSTCIYFLLSSEKFSAFHRINQDEAWHFYDGAPIHLHIISETGEYSKHIIGRDLLNGELPQYVVPGGAWFAAEVVKEDAYSLIGCTVSPGFDFDDFELKSRDELNDLFPQHKELIERLTHY